MASVRVDPTKVLEFEDEQTFYQWLGKHWSSEREVWIKIHKVRSGLASITPTQAIDVVLCWGWIDGIRKGFDDKSFLQRYTPRGKKSVWSQINVANVGRLIKAGRMKPPGLAQVEAARADGRWAKAYRASKTEAPADLLAAIRAEPKALALYEVSEERRDLRDRHAAVEVCDGHLATERLHQVGERGTFVMQATLHRSRAHTESARGSCERASPAGERAAHHCAHRLRRTSRRWQSRERLLNLLLEDREEDVVRVPHRCIESGVIENHLGARSVELNRTA